MLPICGFLAIAQAAQGIPAQEISVQHMRPSKLVTILNQIQPSTVLTADDERGVISVRAGKEIVDQYKSYAGLFDVKPRRVKVRVDADSQIDRSNSTFESVVANNRTFSFSESEIGLEVKAASRINDDGTVTLFVSPTYAKKATTVVFRVKQGEGASLCFAPDGSVSYLAGSSNQETPGKGPIALTGSGVEVLKNAKDFEAGKLRKWPILRFTVSIVEDAPVSK